MSLSKHMCQVEEKAAGPRWVARPEDATRHHTMMQLERLIIQGILVLALGGASGLVVYSTSFVLA